MNTMSDTEQVERLALAMRRAMTIIRHLEVEDDIFQSASTAHMVLYTALEDVGQPVYETVAP